MINAFFYQERFKIFQDMTLRGIIHNHFISDIDLSRSRLCDFFLLYSLIKSLV